MSGRTGVPQGRLLRPFLYLIYKSDLHTFTLNVAVAFTDETTILAILDKNIQATRKLQTKLV